MSWFQSTGLSDTFNALTETVQKAKETVQQAIPAEQRELLAKLTLNTEEMIHERQTFRDEAQRKAEAMGRLGQILPWETKDAEREILVEECKDAILELSKHEETFFGPYEVPMLNVQLDDDDDDDDDANEEQEERQIIDATEEVDNNKDKETIEKEASANELDGIAEAVSEEEKSLKPRHHYHMKPSEESKEKLSKLQPLPPLLEEFDLDSHVGLIQRLLKEDPEYVPPVLTNYITIVQSLFVYRGVVSFSQCSF
jgi:hypothetical protein